MTRVSWTHLQYQLKFEYFGFLIGSQISHILDALWNGLSFYDTTRVMGRMTLKWFHIVEQVLSVSTCHSFSHSRKIPTIYTQCYFNSHSIMRNSLTSSMFIENGTKFIWTIFLNYHSRIYWYQVHFRNGVCTVILQYLHKS